MHISPIGDMPDFSTFLEPKYIIANTAQKRAALISGVIDIPLMMVFCNIMLTPIARMIPIMQGFKPLSTA